MEQDNIELILVFKKEIQLQNAQMILDKAGIKYREGMDSSKGRIYFYKTGPKFILTFETKEERSKFEIDHQNLEEVYEIYTPDWEIQKD